MIVAEVTSKDTTPHHFRKLGSHKDRSAQVFRFGYVEILIVPLVVQITDVRDDVGVEWIGDIIKMRMKSKSTCVFIVAEGVLRRTLVFCSLDLLVQNKNSLVLGLKIRAELLKHRLIKGLKC